MTHFLNRFLSTRARSLMEEGGNETLLVPLYTPTHASFVDTHCTYTRSPNSARFKQIKGATNPWIWCLLIKTVLSILAAIPPFFSLNVYWSRQNYASSLCIVRAYTQSVGVSRSNRSKVVLNPFARRLYRYRRCVFVHSYGSTLASDCSGCGFSVWNWIS